TRGRQFVPGVERYQRRDVDPRLIELADQPFQPRAALRERQLAQVLAILGEQVVGAQMRGEFLQQLRIHGFAVEPLLQHVERLYASIAQDQQLAVDRTVEFERVN